MRSLRAEFIMLNEAGEVVCVLENCVFRVSMMQRRKERQPAKRNIVPKVVAHPLDMVGVIDSTQLAGHLNEWLARPEFLKSRKAYFAEALQCKEKTYL